MKATPGDEKTAPASPVSQRRRGRNSSGRNSSGGNPNRAPRPRVSRIEATQGARKSAGQDPTKRAAIQSNKIAAQASGKLIALKPASKKSPVRKKSPVVRSRRKARRKMPVPLLYFSRLAIVGLGVAALGGTLLKALPNSDAQTVDVPAAEVAPIRSDFPVSLSQEIAPLKAEMQALPNLYPDLTAKAFYVDVDTGSYVNLDGSEAIAAASTIKLPILLAFFEEVDAGRITFEQTLEMLPEQVAEGSGDMQVAAPGTRFTALEVATQMIVTSDNTATNMMIDLLGGPISLNERFASYGLEKTQLNAPLPDIEGANKTSAKDLVHTMLLISSDRLSMRSRDRILNILNRTRNKSLLADGMAQKEALTYNKTGYIGKMLGDVALVDLSNGKRYVVAAMVERPMNDNRATELIHRISNLAYENSHSAILPAVTPLGNPDGEAASPEAGSTAAPGEAVELQRGDSSNLDIAPLEEDPYPSANP